MTEIPNKTKNVDNGDPHGGATLANQHIIQAFLFFGKDREEAEQWIRTSLRITRLYLQGTFLTERDQWRERYPAAPLEEIQMAVTSEIGATLWYLNGGVEEKYKRPSWTPCPGHEWAIRTKALVKYLAAHPEDPNDFEAEKQIERLRRELERISAKIRRGKAALPYRLKHAPAWKLIALGEKGKGKGHLFLRSTTQTILITDSDLAEIHKAGESDHVTIEDDDA